MKVEAKKYTLSYDEYENNVNLLDKILKDKHLSEYKQITIGCWDYEGGDCSALLQGMIENKEKFAQIEGLFWGDIEQEEQEISWIEQADISPLLDAMPKLKDLKSKEPIICVWERLHGRSCGHSKLSVVACLPKW